MKVQFKRFQNLESSEQLCPLPKGCGTSSPVENWALSEQRMNTNGQVHKITMQCPKCGIRHRMYYTNPKCRELMKQQREDQQNQIHPPAWRKRKGEIREIMDQLESEIEKLL